MRRIADFFGLPYAAEPAPDDPISVTRQEFNTAWDELAEAGIPLKADRDQAWRDFKGWRVNYDAVLLSRCGLVMPPYARWSSDRGVQRPRPPIGRLRSP